MTERNILDMTEEEVENEIFKREITTIFIIIAIVFLTLLTVTIRYNIEEQRQDFKQKCSKKYDNYKIQEKMAMNIGEYAAKCINTTKKEKQNKIKTVLIK